MKRRRRHRLVARIGLVVFSLTLVGASCDGKGSPPKTLDRPPPSPQRYVSVVCTEVLKWKNTLEVKASSVVTAPSTVESGNAYVEYALSLTDQMLAQVRAVGGPTAAGGPAVQSEVIQELVAARSALLKVQTDIASLVAKGPLDLIKAVELPILSTVEAIKSELRNPSSIEVDQATVSDTDCLRLFRRKAPVGIGA